MPSAMRCKNDQSATDLQLLGQMNAAHDAAGGALARCERNRIVDVELEVLRQFG